MAGYTRQSSYSDGDTITAAHSNNEFDQVLAAFNNSSGHKHDGTAAEGPVIGLIGDPGVTTPLNKVVVDNTNNRIGVFVDAGGAGSTVEQIRFQDGAIVPVTDNDIDLGTSSLEFKDLYIDGTAHVDAINFNGTAITATAAELNIMDGVTSTAAELNILDGVTSTTAELNILDGVTSTTAELNILDGVTSTAAELNILDGVTATTAELNIMDGVTSTTAELNIMDGVTSTTAELNIMDGVTATTAEINILDGDTAASSTTLADADRVIVNDNGTMKQVALSDFETFFESALDTTSNITTVGALNSGSITSGFGNIDNGSSTITTTGLITGGSLDIDDVVINGTTIGHTDDTDLMTVADGVLTVAGEVSMTTLDIGGTNVTSTAAELNILDGVTSTAAELNILDGVTSTAAELNILDGVTSTTAELNILDGVTSTTAELNILDGVTATAAELNYSDTGASVGTVVASKVVTVDANKDVSSFRNITLTGELDAGSLDISGDADIDGTLEADAITVNGTALNTVIANEATALAIALG